MKLFLTLQLAVYIKEGITQLEIYFNEELVKLERRLKLRLKRKVKKERRSEKKKKEIEYEVNDFLRVYN